jgi:hypothetical protein
MIGMSLRHARIIPVCCSDAASLSLARFPPGLRWVSKAGYMNFIVSGEMFKLSLAAFPCLEFSPKFGDTKCTLCVFAVKNSTGKLSVFFTPNKSVLGKWKYNSTNS